MVNPANQISQHRSLDHYLYGSSLLTLSFSILYDPSVTGPQSFLRCAELIYYLFWSILHVYVLPPISGGVPPISGGVPPLND